MAEGPCCHKPGWQNGVKSSFSRPLACTAGHRIPMSSGDQVGTSHSEMKGWYLRVERGVLWEGYRESRRRSTDTYPESYITKYTSIRR